MSYEKEVAELWKEWKKSTEKYEEAVRDGYDVDADMWASDVETIHRQIHLYEQASKADEYEVKAKAFDAIMREWEDERMTKSHILETIQKYYDEYESGEPNAEK